jgi:hypothetical protein
MATQRPSSQARALRQIGLFVPKAASRCFDRHGFHAAELLIKWEAIVGPEIAAFTLPHRVRWPKAPDRLTEAPRAPAGRGQTSALDLLVEGGRAHEIPYCKRQILDRINAYFGDRAITDIHPIAAPLPRRAQAAPLRRASPEAIAKVRDTLGEIADPNLSQSLARLGASIELRARAKSARS